ncbi:MAG: AAA family ATPase [Symploca sp. SIO2E6]|nr:AAA family ATPase [Symploca sp. SIO2E6]
MGSVVDKRNPYIVGPPIRGADLFFGRDSVFQFIEDNLKQDAVKIILLHGQRRIGKSSVLLNIPNFIGEDEFIFVFFDLQNKSSLNLGDVLHQLAREIVKCIGLPSDDIKLPSVTELEQDTDIFSNQFLPQINQRLNHKKLVVLLDEFDVLEGSNANSSFQKLFPYLKSLIYQQQQLVVIPVIGRHPDDFKKLLDLFKEAPHEEIGLLDELDIKSLITKPAKNVLEYEPEAIEEILKLSAGHPYFTQGICSALFNQARRVNKWRVTPPDIEKIVDRAIRITAGGLAWFRDGMTIPERVVFSAVAEAQARAEIEPDGVVREPLTLLRSYGVIITEPLDKAVKKLCDSGFLDVEPLAQPPVYKIKIELVRRWLVKRYLLRREIWELEELDVDALEIYEEAKQKHQINNMKASDSYKKVLALNPNHFSALFGLAEVHVRLKDINNNYSKAKDFSKDKDIIKDIGEAVELYARAYKVDPVRMGEEFVELLLIYGEHFNSLREFEKAKKQFKQALEIQQDNIQVQNNLKYTEKKLEEIEAKQRSTKELFQALQRSTKVLFQFLIISFLLFLGSSMLVSQVRYILNNRATEREYKERLDMAVLIANNALKFSENYQRIEEFQSASNILNESINELEEIPTSSNSYEDAQDKLTEYNKEVLKLTEQIDELYLEDAAKLAAKAAQQTEQANSIEELEEVKVLWKQALTKLYAISSNSWLTEKADTKTEEYKEELAKIIRKIDEQHLAKAEALAAEAAQQTEQANSIEELGEVRLLWEKALKEIQKISSNSWLTEKANTRKEEYEKELAEIKQQIDNQIPIPDDKK